MLVNVTVAVMLDEKMLFVKTTRVAIGLADIISPALVVRHKARATRKRVTFFISMSKQGCVIRFCFLESDDPSFGSVSRDFLLSEYYLDVLYRFTAS